MKMTRILYGSDFHGSEAVYRKFLSSGLQYKVNALMVGGDVTGKAMVPVIHQGGGKYTGQFSWPTNPQTITVKSSLGGSSSKAVTLK